VKSCAVCDCPYHVEPGTTYCWKHDHAATNTGNPTAYDPTPPEAYTSDAVAWLMRTAPRRPGPLAGGPWGVSPWSSPARATGRPASVAARD